MKHINKFKNHLRTENTELPEGLNWEDMQDGIFHKMEDRPSKAKYFIFNYKKLFSSLIVFLCLIPFLLMFIKEDNSKNEIVSNKLEVKTEENKSVFNNTEKLEKDNIQLNKTVDPKSITELNSLDYLTSNQSNQESKKRLTEKDISPSIANEFKNNINLEPKFETRKDEIIGEPIDDFKEIASDLSYDNESTLNILEIRNNQNSERVGSDESKVQKNNESLDNQPSNRKVTIEYTKSSINADSKNKRSSKYLDQSTVLAMKMANVIKSKSKTQFKDLVVAIPNIKPLRKNLWSLELGSGWNTWSYGLSNADNSSLLYENTHSEYGFTYSLRIARTLNDRFSINSGIDLDYLYKRLEVSYNDYNPRKIDNTLLSFTINSISGDKANLVYGDTIVVDTIVNTLTDYNRFRIVQIPLIVNYKLIRNQTWMLEAGFGPSISMLINYSGKFVENDDLHNYNKTENIYSTSPKIAFNANINIRRNLGGNYYLGIRADFRNHFSPWSSQSEGAIKPKILSGLITLGKSF